MKVNDLTEEVVGLVAAAGLGQRLDLGPKAFLNLGGSTLIRRVVNVLSGCVGRILVGVPHEYLEKARSELAGLTEVYPGAESRQATIFSLFQKCTEPIILIHDVSRPFASKKLASRVIEEARRHGAAVPFVSTPNPVARYEGDFVTTSIPRAEVALSQTPQAYQREILESAYNSAFKNGIETQSTWELVLRLGITVLAIPGEEWNIKITTPLDWEIANKVIAPAVDSNAIGTK